MLLTQDEQVLKDMFQHLVPSILSRRLELTITAERGLHLEIVFLQAHRGYYIWSGVHTGHFSMRAVLCVCLTNRNTQVHRGGEGQTKAPGPK